MKHFILSISFIFIAQFILAQQAEVELTIEPSSVEVGEIFTITVKSNVEGKIEIDNLPSSFVHGYDVLNGMEQEMDYSTGEVITYFFFSQTGAIGKKGKYTIGPAYIKKGNKTYLSNTVDISIGEEVDIPTTDVTAKQLKDPAFGVILTNKKTIYEGEPIVIIAKIYSRFEPTHLEGYQTYEIPGTIDKAKLVGGKRIIVEREKYKSQSFYAFEYDKNVIFPSGTGDFKILPFTMKLNQNFKGYQFKSSSAVVNIQPLPDGAPTDFIGGVGKFELEREIEEVDLKQGDVFKMIVRIKGKGNIQNITEPLLTLPKGFIVYGDPEIEEKYSFNSNGAEGEITYSYNVQVNRAGDKILPSTSISFFDPKQEKYITASSGNDTLSILKDLNYMAQLEKEEESIEELGTDNFLRPSNNASSSDSFFGSSMFWILTTSPLFLSILFIFFMRKKEENADEIEVQLEIKQKSKVLNSSIGELKQELDNGNSTEFYSKLEKTLRGAIELKLQIKKDSSISRNELMNQLSDKTDHQILENVKSIFNQCDQQRYGFSNSDSSKNELFDLAQQTISSLKK